MRDRVARLSERKLALTGSDQSHRIQVTVSEHETNWRAHVTMLRPDGAALGVREVRGRSPSCRGLDVPTALVIATMLDALPAPLRAPAPVELEDEHGEDGRLGFGVLALASTGLGPPAWFGFGLQLELPLVVPITVEAGAYLPATEADGLGRGVRMWGFHGGASACPGLLRGGAFELRACGSAYAGAASARGVGLTEEAGALLPLAVLGIGPKLLIALSEGISAELSASVGWVFVRPRFHWDIEGEPRHAVQASPVALLARIGVIGFAL